MDRTDLGRMDLASGAGTLDEGAPAYNRMDISSRMRRMPMDPRMLAGIVGGMLLVAAVVMLFASPQGKRLRHQAGKRLDMAGREGRHQVESALKHSRKQLHDLQSQTQHRAGDLRHQAKVLRARADVRKLEKKMAHVRG